MQMEELEEFIREKIEREKWTHKKLSVYLQHTYPGQKGFSVRSVVRFCSAKNIHKTSRIEKTDLDIAVQEAVEKVC